MPKIKQNNITFSEFIVNGKHLFATVSTRKLDECFGSRHYTRFFLERGLASDPISIVFRCVTAEFFFSKVADKMLLDRESFCTVK